MSPFSHLLHDLRTSRNIRQAQLAALVGYDQTYISALEVGLKGPPTRELISRLATALSLAPDQADELYEAAEASQRKLVIDTDLPREVYVLLSRLRTSLRGLTPTQVRVINDVLNMTSPDGGSWDTPAPRIVRRGKKEAQM